MYSILVDIHVYTWHQFLSLCMYCVYIHTYYSLKRQVNAINTLADAGMYFWDYGNAFLLEANRAGNTKLSEIEIIIVLMETLFYQPLKFFSS